MGRSQLEGWLAGVLVPVEPSTRFVRRLKARLVRYRGGGLPSAWAIALVVGSIILLVAASASVLIRGMLVVLSVAGLLEQRRRGGGGGNG
jgi:hypothetical protein